MGSPAHSLFKSLQKSVKKPISLPWSTSMSTCRDLTKIEELIHRLFNFAWVNIPLVYTQLVQIAVDMYFFCTLFGFQVNFLCVVLKSVFLSTSFLFSDQCVTFQFLRPTHFLQDSDGTFREVARFTPHAVNLVGHDDSVSDMYVPVIGVLKFVIYNGWLHVSQVLINPLGDDDEDFNVDYIINRNIQISYLMVDGEEDDDEDDLEDPYLGALPAGLPHTVSSSAISAASPIFPTTKVTDSSPSRATSSVQVMESLTAEDRAPAEGDVFFTVWAVKKVSTALHCRVIMVYMSYGIEQLKGFNRWKYFFWGN